MSMKEISPVSFGGGAERLGMVSMHSRCLPSLPDNTWSLQRWVRESKRKQTNNCLSVSKKNPIYWNKQTKKPEKHAYTGFIHTQEDTSHTAFPAGSCPCSFPSFCLPFVFICIAVLQNEQWEHGRGDFSMKSSYQILERGVLKRNVWVSFARKYFIVPTHSCGALVISAAIALKDNQAHPWPKGRCGLVYYALLFRAYVCTGPCGGITGDCPCINHNHQCLINNVCVFLLSLFKRSSREVVVLLPAQLLTCCAASGRLLHQKKGWRRESYFQRKYLDECTKWLLLFLCNTTVKIFIEINVEIFCINFILST